MLFRSKLNILNYISINAFDLSFKFFSIKSFRTDVLIIGGGIMGCSTAYWLKTMDSKLDITVIERDKAFKQCSTVLSVGGVRQQFSEKENIKMSMFCGDVLSNMEKYFDVPDESEDLDVQFMRRGYLLLSSDLGVPTLTRNFQLQRELGASVDMLSGQQIKDKFPWLNTEDVACGVLGSGNEGWFDPWLLLCHVRRKNRQLGVCEVNGRVTQFDGIPVGSGNQDARIFAAKVLDPKGTEETVVEFDYAINAAGAWAEQVVVMAERACGMSGCDYPLLVKKCKRYVYCYSCRDFPSGVNTPMVVDFSGIYFRREGCGDFICGLSPPVLEEPTVENLDVDYDWFDRAIWPSLSHRVPSKEGLRVRSAWAGFYDYNVRDQNLIVGPHPRLPHLLLANGSSGHGIQHALAVGRANAELILYGQYRTIDLSRLEYSRFLRDELVMEKNII